MREFSVKLCGYFHRFNNSLLKADDCEDDVRRTHMSVPLLPYTINESTTLRELRLFYIESDENKNKFLLSGEEKKR